MSRGSRQRVPYFTLVKIDASHPPPTRDISKSPFNYSLVLPTALYTSTFRHLTGVTSHTTEMISPQYILKDC